MASRLQGWRSMACWAGVTAVCPWILPMYERIGRMLEQIYILMSKNQPTCFTRPSLSSFFRTVLGGTL